MTVTLPTFRENSMPRSTNPNSAMLSSRPLFHVNSIILLRDERKQKHAVDSAAAKHFQQLKMSNLCRVFPGEVTESEKTVDKDDLFFLDREEDSFMCLEIRQKSYSGDCNDSRRKSLSRLVLTGLCSLFTSTSTNN